VVKLFDCGMLPLEQPNVVVRPQMPLASHY
jgi:hypothetical protein